MFKYRPIYSCQVYWLICNYSMFLLSLMNAAEYTICGNMFPSAVPLLNKLLPAHDSYCESLTLSCYKAPSLGVFTLVLFRILHIVVPLYCRLNL